MKHKIKFTLSLFVAIAGLMFSCNQLSDKSITVKSEIAKLEAERAKIDLETMRIYDSISLVFEKEDSLKAGYQDIIFGIKERTDELLYYTLDVKIEMVTALEGEGSAAISEKEINISEIKRMNDKKVPSAIMIGNENGGKAQIVKVLLEDYKGFLIEMVKSDPQIKANVESLLNTDDQKKVKSGKDTGETESWVDYTFEGQPMGQVLLSISQIQNNIKTAESDVLSFILNEMNSK